MHSSFIPLNDSADSTRRTFTSNMLVTLDTFEDMFFMYIYVFTVLFVLLSCIRNTVFVGPFPRSFLRYLLIYIYSFVFVWYVLMRSAMLCYSGFVSFVVFYYSDYRERGLFALFPVCIYVVGMFLFIYYTLYDTMYAVSFELTARFVSLCTSRIPPPHQMAFLIAYDVLREASLPSFIRIFFLTFVEEWKAGYTRFYVEILTILHNFDQRNLGFEPMGDDFVEQKPTSKLRYRLQSRNPLRDSVKVRDHRLRLITAKDLLDYGKTFSSKLFEPAPRFNRADERVYGRTWFAKKEFMFPVTCDVESFCQFVNTAITDHYEDAVHLFLHGIISVGIRRLYQTVLLVPIQPMRRYKAMGPDFSEANPSIDDLGSNHFLASMIHICHLAYGKDYTGLFTYFMTRKDWCFNLMKILNLPSVESVLEWMRSCLFEETAGEWSFADVLPIHIKQSKIVQYVIKLVTFLTFSHLTSESSILAAVQSQFDFSKVTETSFSVLLVTQVLHAVFQGFQRLLVGDTFWGLTSDVSFSRDAAEILEQADFSFPLDQAQATLDKINALLKSRENLRDSHEIVRLKDKLCDRARDIHRLVRNNSPRTQTVPIWLNGDPGVGKTTIIESLISRLAVRDKVPRRIGDIIFYNIHDPFPVESGALCDARYLVINDIRANYANDVKEGLLPLDVLLQQIIDTSPAELKQAFNKGVLFYNLQYVFITSNHNSYVMGGDSEKLIRRLEGGVLCDISFNTKVAKNYADACALSQTERNKSLTFKLLNVEVRGTRLWFTDQKTSFSSYASFFSFVEWKTLATQELNRKNRKLFTENLCACGLARAFHVDSDNFIRLNEDCNLENMVEHVPSSGSSSVLSKEDLRVARERFLSPGSPLSEVINNEDRDESGQSGGNAIFRPQHLPDSRILLEEEREEKHPDPDFVFQPMSSDFGSYHVLNFLYFSLMFLALMQLIEKLKFLVLCIYQAGNACRRALEEVKSSSMRELVVVAEHFPNGRRVFVSDTWFRRVQVFVLLSEFKRKLGQFLKENTKYILIALGMGTVGYYVTKPKLEETGNVALGKLVINSKTIMRTSDMVNPTADPRKREWTTAEPYQTWKFQTKGVSNYDLEDMCRNATIPFVIKVVEENVKTKVALGFILNGNTVLFNRHTFQMQGKFVPMLEVEHNGTIASIRPEDLIQFPGTELVAIQNIWYADFKDLSKFLPTSLPTAEAQLDVDYLSPRGTIKAVGKISNCTLFGVNYPTLRIPHAVEKGDCMSPIIGKIGGSYFIAGFLIALETNFHNLLGSYSHFTMLRNIDLLTFVETSAPLEVEYSRFPENLSPLPAVSQWCNFRLREIKPLGTNTEEIGNSFRSRITKTRLYNEASEKLSEQYSFPNKVGGMHEGVYKSSWTNTFKHMDLQDSSSMFLRKRAAHCYAQDCVRNAGGTKLRPLTVVEAFQGEIVSSVDKIKYKTSCGKTWRLKGFKTKEDLFKEVEEGVFEIDQTFLDSLDELLAMIKEGKCASILVDYVHKDEVRPLSKLEEFKIRLFSVLDADVNIVFRMYFMPLISVLLANPEDSECFGQLNAASDQWTSLAHYLQKHGNACIDMDFSAFDTSHSCATFAMVGLCFAEIGKALGYDQDECTIVRNLVHMLNIQVMSYMSDYFFKSKGMPSGVVLTLILNSMVNSMMSRMAFSILTQKDCSEYKDFVHTATVGDDNASNVHDSILDAFNIINIAPLYHSWGYVVTPARKGTEMVKSMTLSEITFVKRNFVKREDGMYLAPLAKDSIYKSLCFEMKDGCSSAERLVSVYQSAIREAFLHGKSFFEEFDLWVKDLYSRNGLTVPIVLYDDIEEAFKSSGFTTAFA